MTHDTCCWHCAGTTGPHSQDCQDKSTATAKLLLLTPIPKSQPAVSNHRHVTPSDDSARLKRASQPDARALPRLKRRFDEASTFAAPSGIDTICVGTRVELTGLQKRPDLNGIAGTCVEYDQTEQRWYVEVVTCESVKRFRLKIDNLIVTAPARVNGGTQPAAAAALAATGSYHTPFTQSQPTSTYQLASNDSTQVRTPMVQGAQLNGAPMNGAPMDGAPMNGAPTGNKRDTIANLSLSAAATAAQAQILATAQSSNQQHGGGTPQLDPAKTGRPSRKARVQVCAISFMVPEAECLKVNRSEEFKCKWRIIDGDLHSLCCQEYAVQGAFLFGDYWRARLSNLTDLDQAHRDALHHTLLKEARYLMQFKLFVDRMLPKYQTEANGAIAFMLKLATELTAVVGPTLEFYVFKSCLHRLKDEAHARTKAKFNPSSDFGYNKMGAVSIAVCAGHGHCRGDLTQVCCAADPCVQAVRRQPSTPRSKSNINCGAQVQLSLPIAVHVAPAVGAISHSQLEQWASSLGVETELLRRG